MARNPNRRLGSGDESLPSLLSGIFGGGAEQGLGSGLGGTYVGSTALEKSAAAANFAISGGGDSSSDPVPRDRYGRPDEQLN